MKEAPARPGISIVVPVFNEAEVLHEAWSRLSGVLRSMDEPFEVIFVNDGSKDATGEILAGIHAREPSVTVINLSRNFGKEYALTAGMDFVQGDAAVIIDADMQDPPELIPDMVAAWREGFDVVTMRRSHREGESALKRGTAWLFYRLLNRISDVEIPPDTGDFRLLSDQAVQAVRNLPERVRYMKGIFAWVGFRQKEILYERDARAAGRTKWGFLKLMRLALDGITAFSTTPLRIASYVGFVTALGAFAVGVFFIFKTLVFGDPVPGFPSLITWILFLGGVQLMAIGVLGEYVGRLFTESKQRPHYLISSVLRHAPEEQERGGRAD